MAPASTMKAGPCILFLTLPEHGQANVHLAVLQSLAASHPEASLHLGSFSSLAPRVPPNVTFHSIEGVGIGERLKALIPTFAANPNLYYNMATTCTGLVGTISGFIRVMPWGMHPETPAENVASICSAAKVIEALAPDLVIVDVFFDQAADAVEKVQDKTKIVLLSPNTLKELTLGDQGAGVFSIPCGNTGYSYPVPWYLLPSNIVCILTLGLWTNIAPTFRAINAARNAAGYDGNFPLFRPRNYPTLCLATPELEYPCIIPPHIIPCSVINLPAPPLEQVDAELASWVHKEGRRTIMIVLGSHMLTDEAYALNLLKGVKAILKQREDIQVLWRHKALGKYTLPEVAELGDRLRIVSWLAPDPICVLQTRKVVCFVHHGGSNSYHEALSTGTPQLILSGWFDCHDFGVRAEWLGVGVWGNRHHAPYCDGSEFTQALHTVVGDDTSTRSAVRVAEKAKSAAETVRLFHGGGQVGRDYAAEWIWERTMTVTSVV